MDEDRIRHLLDYLGQAISAEDWKGVSACWTFPAMFVSEADAMIVAQASQVELPMAQAAGAYRARGINSTRPELERIEQLGERLVSVDVRWRSYDSSGAEKASERSHYLLQAGGDGQLRIRVALTRTK